jgi:hypothetical protein
MCICKRFIIRKQSKKDVEKSIEWNLQFRWLKVSSEPLNYIKQLNII